MIDKNVVKKLVEEWLQDKEYFLVSIEISPDDRIVVEIDHADGVWIEDCVALSKYIEDHLNRDEEDYELEVGSAGLGQPFKVPQQYINFIGKEQNLLSAVAKLTEDVVLTATVPPQLLFNTKGMTVEQVVEKMINFLLITQKS